jgi:hypothetical protein
MYAGDSHALAAVKRHDKRVESSQENVYPVQSEDLRGVKRAKRPDTDSKPSHSKKRLKIDDFRSEDVSDNGVYNNVNHEPFGVPKIAKEVALKARERMGERFLWMKQEAEKAEKTAFENDVSSQGDVINSRDEEDPVLETSSPSKENEEVQNVPCPESVLNEIRNENQDEEVEIEEEAPVSYENTIVEEKPEVVVEETIPNSREIPIVEEENCVKNSPRKTRPRSSRIKSQRGKTKTDILNEQDDQAVENKDDFSSPFRPRRKAARIATELIHTQATPSKLLEKERIESVARTRARARQVELDNRNQKNEEDSKRRSEIREKVLLKLKAKSEVDCPLKLLSHFFPEGLESHSKTKTPSKAQLVKIFIKALAHYHPDRKNNRDLSLEDQVEIEEIYKILNQRKSQL